MARKHWQDGVTLVIGVWLIFALYLLGVTAPEGGSLTAVRWDFILSGGVAVVLSLSALFAFREWEEWVTAALGVWLIASPWVLGFSGIGAATSAAVISGVILAAMGIWTSMQSRDEGTV